MAVSRREQRRPARWILFGVVILATALVLGAAMSGRRHPVPAMPAYLDQVRAQFIQTNNSGMDLADIRLKADKLGRDAAKQRLDSLVASVKQTLAVVSALSPPPTLRVAHAYLVTSLGVRATATEEFRTAMEAAFTEGPPDPAVAGLGQTGLDMQLSERAHAMFA